MHAVLGDQCACGATLVEAGAKLDLVDLTGKSAIIHVCNLIDLLQDFSL